MKKRIFAIILALAILFSLTSCIRYHGTVKLNADGTTEATYLIAAVPEALTDPETGEKQPLINDETLEVYKALGFEVIDYAEDGYEGYILKVSSESLVDPEDLDDETLEHIADDELGVTPMMTSTLLYIEGDYVILDVALPTALSESSDPALLKQYGAYDLMTIEFPVVPIETNATSVSEDKKALTWDAFEANRCYAKYTVADFEEAGVDLSDVPVNPFTDVKADDYFHDAVLWAYFNGITTGTSATKFSPASTCTRGQVVTFLWRAMGEPEPETKENPFTDVKESDYYYKPILWAVENGITNGTSATKFSPNTTCSYAHILTFIWRAIGEPEDFESEGTEWYSDAVEYAYYAGITEGILDLESDPMKPCPRADVVTFLYRLLNF